jgi:hypothetical protein
MRVQRSATREVSYVILDDNDQVIEVVSAFMRQTISRVPRPMSEEQITALLGSLRSHRDKARRCSPLPTSHQILNS